MNTRSLVKSLAAASAVVLSACSSTPKASVAPVYGPTNPSPDKVAKSGVRTFGSIIELKPEKEKLYRELHADVWPDVIAGIRKSKIRNFNIYIVELRGKKYLVSHFEYTGKDPKKDFAAMAKDPTTRDKWWPITDGCQERLPGTPKGEQWLSMEQVMHLP